MLRRYVTALAAFCSCLALCPAARGGPVLEDILNSMQLDQVLQRSGDDFIMIDRANPPGQTFVTGDNVVRICRIAVRVASWNDEWQPGETLVMTLYDGPDKKTQLGRFDIPYARRLYQDAVLMFYVEADVKPNTHYYFELNVEGGNGKIAGLLLSKFNIDYPGGKRYEGGKQTDRNIWFETHVKKTANRDALYLDFFNNFNLDYPGMGKIKTAVAAKDWDTACREFLTYIEGRRDLMNDEDATPKLDPKFDTREADLVCEQKWPAMDGIVADLGPNWNYFANWPTMGGVGLTRTGLQKPLAFAYGRTGNEKYARAWNDMLIAMFRNHPSPLKSGVITTEGKIRPTVPAGISGALWDSLSIAARMHHETFYNRFRNTPIFTQDVRMAWWANLADMVNCLERMDAGGNWTTQNTSSLFGFARKYPEFKKAKQWFTQGFDGIKANFLENMYPDGPCKEATTNYHSFSLGMFFDVFRTAREIGLPVSDEHMARLEKSFEYSMYIVMPNWQTPIWGDTNRPMDQTGLLAGGGAYFKRDDMAWVGSKGKVGKMPAKTSVSFPEAGYFVMRSGWDPKARYLTTRNGYSQSHYHADQLSIILNAYGVDLLPDPGVYTYGTPECNKLMETTSHSTVCIDGKNIAPGNGDSKWVSIPGMDFYDGASPGYRDIPDVKHRRSILFLKPDYWVVADRVTGPGEHQAVQYWHFTPGDTAMDASGATRTKNAAGGNLAVLPLYAQSRNDELTKDVYALDWEHVTTAPVAKYERRGQLPLAFCTVLFPYPANNQGRVAAEDLNPSTPCAPGEVMGARVTTADWIDYVAFNSTSHEAALDPGGITLDGDAGFVKTSAKNGAITKFGLCNGTKLVFGKKVLVASSSPVKGLRVYYSDGVVTVDAQDACPDVKIPTCGAKRAVVNGKWVRIAAGAAFFEPFAHR